MPDAWSLLREAARTAAVRVGPPGEGLVRTSTGWRREGADPDGLLDLHLPLLADGVRVVGHLAQSLDGRIALPDGRSRWISGDADLVHTHRLRALCDAVLVGANTVLADDPQLTVRRVEGDSPIRVVIDPHRRLPPDRAVFRDGGCWRITTVASADDPDAIVLDADGGVIDPRAVLAALADRGVRRILVEGGGVTVSRFLAARALDRLHLVIASVLVGAGRAALTLPSPLADSLDACPRPNVRSVPLGGDVLLDVDLRY